VQGCCLAWHANNPAWLTSRPWTKAQLRSFLRQYVTTVVSRYRGRVAQWDVVNEGLASSTPQTGPFGVRAADDIWGRALGPGYIADAFRWAHEADPNAQLFYNDYGAEAPGAKFNAEFAMVKQLRAQGVPITGVGLQTHRPVPSGPPYYPTMRQVETVLRSFQGIGVTTELTELDQPFRLPPTVADLRLQARLFADMFKACLDVSTCTGVTVWGVYDADTYPTLRRNHLGAATLINTGGIPKPAFYAVENALRTAPGVPAAERSSPGQPA
jgi:endo-1,4-beta-xylanase